MNSHSWTSQFLSNFVFPAYHILLNDTLWPKIREYQKSQWKAKNELINLQRKKLFKILRHCQKNIPYYKKIFKDLGIKFDSIKDLDNFKKLPFLTKKIINENKNKLLALNLEKNDLVYNHTSGSTGENLFFYQDKNSMLYRQAVVWRNQEWTGCLYTDRQVFLWGAPFDLKKSESIKNKIHSKLKRSISFSTYNLSENSLRNYANRIEKFRPRLIVSYPSPLTVLAEFLQANNYKIPSIKSIITSAETLYPWQRKTIEKTFERPVFDRYGTREFGNIAQECEKHCGYHINVERFFLEIIGEDGYPTKNGDIGEIYVTDLDNYGFPFIRYKIQDLAIPTYELCDCGRGLPLLKKIEGRTFDIVKVPNGNKIGGTFWTLAMRSIEGVKNFQVVQPSIGKIEIKMVVNQNFNDTAEKKIKRIIKERCGYGVKIEINKVKKIPLTKSGKRRFVISNID